MVGVMNVYDVILMVALSDMKRGRFGGWWVTWKRPISSSLRTGSSELQ